jgi:hypothetical protein
MMYAADSESSSSPWMESLVFPENPSGVIKTTQLADSNRRVCDGVYLWPMYFGMRVSAYVAFLLNTVWSFCYLQVLLPFSGLRDPYG